MALTLTLGGTEYISFVDFRSIVVQNIEELKGSTMDFRILVYDRSIPKPKAGNEIIFQDGSTKEFAGVLSEVATVMGEGNLALFYECSGIGYEFFLDRRYLNKVYSSQRADLMVGEILDDLQNASNSLDTHYNDFQGDKSLLTVGPDIRQQRFENVLPTEAIQVIEEASGMRFNVTFDKQVQLKFLDDVEAPLPTPSGRVRATLDVDNNITDYNNIRLVESILGTGSKAIVPSTGIKSTNTITDTFIWNTGQDVKFILSRRPFSELDITSVRINGGAALSQLLEDVAVDANADPGTGSVAIYIGPAQGKSPSYVRLDPADLSNGDSVTVTYNYAVEDDHEGLRWDVIPELENRTDGDGVHEFIWSRASGLQVEDIEDLDLITEVLLDRKAKIHRNGQFNSFTKGWAAGQTFDLLWLSDNIDEQMYVTQVRKTVRTPAGNTNDPSAGDPWIETQILFSNVPRGNIL